MKRQEATQAQRRGKQGECDAIEDREGDMSETQRESPEFILVDKRTFRPFASVVSIGPRSITGSSASSAQEFTLYTHQR